MSRTPPLIAGGDEHAISALTGLLTSGTAESRRAALDALVETHDTRVVPALIQFLGRTESLVRRMACAGLGQLGDARTVPPLIQRLGDHDKEVRQLACVALQRLGQGRLANAVLAAMERKPDAWVELARFETENDRRPVEPLIESAKDSWKAGRTLRTAPPDSPRNATCAWCRLC